MFSSDNLGLHLLLLHHWGNFLLHRILKNVYFIFYSWKRMTLADVTEHETASCKAPNSQTFSSPILKVLTTINIINIFLCAWKHIIQILNVNLSTNGCLTFRKICNQAFYWSVFFFFFWTKATNGEKHWCTENPSKKPATIHHARISNTQEIKRTKACVSMLLQKCQNHILQTSKGTYFSEIFLTEKLNLQLSPLIWKLGANCLFEYHLCKEL